MNNRMTNANGPLPLPPNWYWLVSMEHLGIDTTATAKRIMVRIINEGVEDVPDDVQDTMKIALIGMRAPEMN